MNKNIVKIAAGTMIASTILAGNTGLPYNVMKDPVAHAATTNVHGVPKPPIEVISLQNGSFEQPAVPYGEWQTFDQSEVPGWQTTASDGLIEIQNHNEDRDAADGEQYAELNAYEASALYQDIATTPGAKVRWQVSHRGRHTTDTATVKFGAPGNLKLIDTMTTSVDAWKTYSGTYTIPAGQTTTRFEFEAVGGDPTNGNLLDNIVFATQSFITVSGNIDKTSVKKDKTATYSFDAKNEGGMASQKTTLSIPIPQEVTLASPNVMVDGVSVAGSYDSNTRILSIPLGSITKDATKHITFDVKGAVVANNVTTQATVTHQDLGFTDEDYTNYSNDVTLSVLANNAPTITATDHTLKKGGKFDPMAGVSATDPEDGNLSSSVKITANDVDTSKEGIYHVTYSVTDSDGNVTTKQVTVTVTSNDAPTITATDHTLKKGAKFDPMADVSAEDAEDGNLTKDIKITANDVDTSKEGVYHITYSVTDSDNNTTTKQITVTVTSNDVPTIEATDHTLKKGTAFDPMSEVSATDKEDGDLTKDIQITANDVDTSKEGVYHVTYSVTDSDNNTTTKQITVTVTSNDVPTIEATDHTLKKGTAFDPMSEVSATDKEDGNLTKDIQITANDVDTSKEGVYHVTYSVTDSDNNTTTKQITVTVTSNDAPIITATDKTLKRGDTFDALAEVSATDREDGDLTSDIQIIANDVNPDQEGVYSVTYSVTDSDNNTTTKQITVTVTSNELPVILATDHTIKKGSNFDPMSEVSATDKEDGDLTNAIKITANDVNTNQEGIYQITYSVTDSDNNTTTKNITVIVTSNEKPTIQAEDQTIKKGTEFDPIADVTATDQEDGDLTKTIKVIRNTVDTTKEGVYQVSYEVIDSDGNIAYKTITVTVTSNEKPTITAEDQVITVGDNFDPQQLATSSDQEDGDLTKQIEIISNTVDTSQPGTYKVVYRVTDSDNNTVEKTITVTVLPKAAEITPPPATPEITPVVPVKTQIITPVEYNTSIITPDNTPIVTQTASELPTTGDQSTKTPIVLGGALISLAYFLFRRKK
ncbi:immunoglobulin-like domain-containing protein [Listeria riparia]|uniref:Putative peptidoglycan linked protein n=1 Tax=Listeria riparia FSL S10-1204 TaxID=1265816 RepID=W7DBU4_9LIST|nr:immunoglobulin-like domain-containing protein [Listeria riparia]EUJ42738.1 putative peptidoglycan linked protein [Listeria riparia FSL S10-1204]